jgi:hypothetical protein
MGGNYTIAGQPTCSTLFGIIEPYGLGAQTGQASIEGSPE